MASCLTVTNATSVLPASKRFQKTSIVSTIAVMSALSRFNKSCKGTDKSDDSVSRELLQLDLAAQSLQIHCSTTGRISNSSLEVAPYGNLSHIIYDALSLEIQRAVRVSFRRTSVKLMSTQPSQHAIVIGGSIAGLLAARVLAEQFEQVTIVDRDCLPLTAEPRRGVPQSVQPHVLFARGYQILEELFPNIGEALAAAGAVPFDWGKDFLYFQASNASPRTEIAIGMQSYTCTRPLLESIVRQRVKTLPNVRFLQEQQVVGLACQHSMERSNRSSIQGVKLQQGELSAQLVVDASGRSTQTPQWLQDLGLTSPRKTVVDPGLGYATRRYRIPAEMQPDCKILLISQEPPHQPRLGYLAEVENNQWIATLGGYGHDYPPLEDQGFLQFAQTLSDPTFYQAIAQAEPLSEIRAHRATANRMYHYEEIHMPDGLIAIGDAVCALCPVYGQGMTVSAISSLVLRRWLAHSRSRQASWNGTSFQKQLAQSNAFPWSLATGFDSKFPTTKGAITTQNWVGKLLEGYMDRLALLAQKDVEVHLKFLQMAHMLKSPSSLLDPQLVLKVLS
jgi:2-polyprenyl-6-methoxyphenol hydroxylase-like FAD-dependent oxidoreductase